MSQESESQDSITTLAPADRNEVMYFAYGSNLSLSQMLARCPDSVPVALAYLPGWEWIINRRGYANIVFKETSHLEERKGMEEEEGAEGKGKGKEPATAVPEEVALRNEPHGVYGIVYLVPPDDEASLDRYEGVRFGAYDRGICEVELLGSEYKGTVSALVYFDPRNVTGSEPNEEYVERMNRGVREAMDEFGFPEEYVERVIRKFIPEGDEEEKEDEWEEV